MAIIFIFLSLFTSVDPSHGEFELSLTDSLKKERRQNASVDSTGRFLIINRVFILGNRLTREQIILRELTLKSGDVIYSLDLPGIIDLDKKKLFNTRLFNTVDIRTQL
jgi:outer membrane protein assembly factor BamA